MTPEDKAIATLWKQYRRAIRTAGRETRNGYSGLSRDALDMADKLATRISTLRLQTKDTR